MLGINKEQAKAIRSALAGRLYCFECKNKTKLNKELARKQGTQKCDTCGAELFNLKKAEEYKKEFS